MLIKICEICKKEFKNRNKNQRFCSRACYGKSRCKDTTRKCLFCKNEFNVSYVNHNQKFCSSKCFGLSVRTRKLINCLGCGREFKQKNSNQKFCSKICSQKSRCKNVYQNCEECNKKFKMSNKNQRFCSRECANLNLHQKTSSKECEFCGEVFISNIHFRKYCGDKCAKAAHKEKSKKIIKECEECSITYATANKNQKFCSLQCVGKRMSKLRLLIPTKDGKKKVTYNKKRSYLSRYNAEKKINRKLKKGEVVHHIDCDPRNDIPDNLYVFKSNGDHVVCHGEIYRLVKGLLEDSIIEFVDGRYERI
jgi:hypothetical protein